MLGLLSVLTHVPLRSTGQAHVPLRSTGQAHIPLRSTGQAHVPLRSTGQAHAPLRSTGQARASRYAAVCPMQSPTQHAAVTALASPRCGSTPAPTTRS